MSGIVEAIIYLMILLIDVAAQLQLQTGQGGPVLHGSIGGFREDQ